MPAVADATVGVTHQDQRLAERVDAAGCPVVVLINKWELLDAEQRASLIVPDDAHGGEAAFVVLVDGEGRPIAKLPTTIGGDG